MANQDARKIATVEVHFAQRLAANEKKIRDRAIKKLRKWLEVRSLAKKEKAFTEADLLKIWKGLHYGLWMQDKPLLQEEMSANISRLVHVFNLPESALLFVQVFLQTEAREWHGIDCWRIDKFMMLFRNILTQTLEYIKKRKWKKSLISNFTDVLSSKILTEAEERIPDGLKIHLADIYLDELESVGAEELSPQKILSFLEPFSHYIQTSKNWNIVLRVISRVFNAIIEQTVQDAMSAAEKQLEKEEEDSDNEKDDNEDDEDIPVRLQYDFKALADRLFALGSSTDCRNRGQIYILVKKFKDLDEGILPQEKGEEEEEADVLSKKDIRDAVRLLEKSDGSKKKKKKKRKRRNKQKNQEGNQSGISQEDDDETEENKGSSETKDELNDDSGVEFNSEFVTPRGKIGSKKKKKEYAKMSELSSETVSPLVNSGSEVSRSNVNSTKKSEGKNKSKLNESIETNTDGSSSVNGHLTPKYKKGKKVETDDLSSGMIVNKSTISTSGTDNLEHLSKSTGKKKRKSSAPNHDPELSVTSESTLGKESVIETPEVKVAKTDPVSLTKIKSKRKSIISDNEISVTPVLNMPKLIENEPSSSKRSKNKRKSSVSTTEMESVTTPLSSKSQKAKMTKLIESVDGTAAYTPKSTGSEFAQFETLMKTPPAFVRKSVSKLKTPKTAPNKKISQEPPASCVTDSKKKVIFNMKKNESLSFLDSIKFSPGVFNPSKNPDHGILKTPSPAVTRSQAAKKKQAAMKGNKKRASTGGIKSRSKASDFF